MGETIVYVVVEPSTPTGTQGLAGPVRLSSLVVPDLRPASELTPDRLTWPSWVIVGDFGADCRSGLSLVDDGDPGGLAITCDGAERWYVDRVRVYPCHDGQPWLPATWNDVDEKVKR